MKRNLLIFIIYATAVMLLTIVTFFAFGENDEAVTCTKSENMRVSAPMEVYDDVNVRREVIATETVEEVTSVSAAAPETVTVNVYELMDSTPLRTEVQMMIEDVCAARDVDVRVVLAIIEVESGFNERAIGDRCQSYGLMQVQPRWHGERMARLGVADLLDGEQNVLVGIDYLDELLDRYGGDYYKALTAYNAGHYRGVVSAYANKVMAIAEEVTE